MKYASVLLAAACLLSSAHAQWLETTIQLDSGATPLALCYNSANDKVYSANRHAGTVTVIDAATNDVIATVPVAESRYDICYNAQLNRVYCGVYVISVIDGSTDSVVATIDGASAYVLIYNPQNNKVYGGGTGPDVTVIDCEGDSVLPAIPAWGSPLAFCCNSQNNKVYYAAKFGDHVGIIDGATDSLLAELPLSPGAAPRALCYNPQNNKVYCSATDDDRVVVIDGDSDSIVAEVQVDRPVAICCNQQGTKVYVALNFGGIAVIDCATDSVVATVPTQTNPEAILHNPMSNKVFCASLTMVTVIDAAADTVLRTIEVGRGLADLSHGPTQNRVYVASANDAAISVLRDSMQGVEESFKQQAPSHKLAATVIRSLPQGAVAFDAMGRRVPNPRSGIFFVRQASSIGCEAASVTKVVIQH
jgi:YVTN family beta-propeller protein